MLVRVFVWRGSFADVQVQPLGPPTHVYVETVDFDAERATAVLDAYVPSGDAYEHLYSCRAVRYFEGKPYCISCLEGCGEDIYDAWENSPPADLVLDSKISCQCDEDEYDDDA